MDMCSTMEACRQLMGMCNAMEACKWGVECATGVSMGVCNVMEVCKQVCTVMCCRCKQVCVMHCGCVNGCVM